MTDTTTTETTADPRGAYLNHDPTKYRYVNEGYADGVDLLAPQWRAFHDDWLRAEALGKVDSYGGSDWRSTIALVLACSSVDEIREALWYAQVVGLP